MDFFRHPERIHFDLKSNCLLTRWPVVFVTGPRSLFYFRRYWNLYPIYLAEHGYEVFTVHLPWLSFSKRRKKMQAFLKLHQNKKYHFVMDSISAHEMHDLLESSSTAVSVTELANAGSESRNGTAKFRTIEMLEGKCTSPCWEFLFGLHQRVLKNPQSPRLSTLGALEDSMLDNSRLLLAHMQCLAEKDYQEEAIL